MSQEVVFKILCGHQALLHTVIETQLANGHQDLKCFGWINLITQVKSCLPPACRPIGTREHCSKPFLPGNPYHAVHSMLVADNIISKTKKMFLSCLLPPHLYSQLDIILHPDIDQIPRGSYKPSTGSSSSSHHQSLAERNGLPVWRHLFLHCLIDSKPGGGVGKLPH